MVKTKSIHASLRLSFTILVIISVVLTSAIFAYFRWTKFWRMHADSQAYFTKYTSSQIDGWFDEHFRKILFVSQVSNLVNQNPEYQKNLLNSIIESNSAIQEIVIFDAGQKVANAQNQAFHDEHEYRTDTGTLDFVLKTGIEYIDICRWNENSADKILLVVYPLRDNTGRINGALMARLKLSYLKHLISRLRFGKSGYAYIIDPQNRIILHN
ncbi:MAG: cache domain-containing protein, partial [Candidatus Cloacimonadaceae bacterium]|nr:cache domain-containing protein [Candidatus Cloacimonadaceae bacterium]